MVRPTSSAAVIARASRRRNRSRPISRCCIASRLPTANHVFLPGHRIMVQIQSSWFPLYDRNPQTFVPNIFWAKPGDYRKATQRIYHAPGQVELRRAAAGDGTLILPNAWPLTSARDSRSASAAVISSRIAGSSIVGGTRVGHAVGDLLDRPAHDLARAGLGQPLDRDRGLERRHRPDPLADQLDQLRHQLLAAPGRAPALSTTRPRGTSPLSASATPTTAHSATSGCAASTSSIAPVDSRCPATLITSSVRLMIQR